VNLLSAAPTCIFHAGKLACIPSAKLAHLLISPPWSAPRSRNHCRKCRATAPRPTKLVTSSNGASSDSASSV